MRTAVRLLVVCLLSAVLVFIPATYRSAEAQSGTLYDNFNSLLINPAKWYGNEEMGLAVQPPEGAAEIFRGLVAGELVMYHRMHGNPGNPENTGANGHIMRLNVRDPAPVTGMRARITVRQYQLQACPLNPQGGGAVTARLVGVFFNAGTPAPGSREDDVIAGVTIRRRTDSVDPSNVFQVRTVVQRCGDANCFEVEGLDPVDLGTVNVGQSTTVSVRWDESGSFLFRRDGNPEVQIVYPWSDDAPPSVPRKGVLLNSSVANCTSPTTVASILATFDNFYVSP